MARILRLAVLLALIAVAPRPAAAQEDDTATTAVAPDAWLALPAVDLPAPAAPDTVGADAIEPFDRVSLPLDGLQPAAGEDFAWPGREDALRWGEVPGGEVGDPGDRLRVLVAYVETAVFVSAPLKLTAPWPARVFVDGEQLLDKKGTDADAKKDVDLEPGQHTVVVLLTGRAEGEAAADDAGEGLVVQLDVDDAGAAGVRFDTDPTHGLAIDELLDMEVVTGVSVSADGKIAAIGMRTPQPPSEDQRSWVEFVATEDGELLQSLEGVGTISSLRWAPRGQRYAFVTRDDGKTTLWIAEFDGERPRILREGLEDFGSFRWMPDASGLIYSISEDGEKDPENVKRYRDLADRWAGSRDRSFLYQVSVDDGVARRLTAGALSTSLQDIAPDGGSLLFTVSERNDAEWPFSRDLLYELDLEDLSTRQLADVIWGLGAQYAQDGRKILITANPSAFGEIGENVPEGVEPNLYDNQAYLMDRESGEVEALTRDFDPAIDEIAFSRATGDILARATVGTRDQLFRYDTGDGEWSQLDSPVDVIGRMDLSADGSTVVFEGDGPFEPWRVLVASFDGRWRPKEIRKSTLDVGGRIRAGTIEEFDFTKDDGTVIDGHVYFPAGYDASRKWPALVYYYGGTSPVTRDFGGRYPKEYWAANGYVVYVLEPSGATGYGQEFSARHVNDWGKTTIDEIIQGTKEFLAAHPAVDPARVGCLGASYGGFMTELLMTRTDIFAAAVSHAGISSISSYWGEGNWGFAYSAGATAHSYPWNRPDIYVDQSALFSADRITTPLLLLHGGDDDNVPPGESEQLYTALRVLGKPVEYVRIAGEKHWILQREKRSLWARTIVAWFDRWLKDDAGWWDHLYSVDEK